MTISDRFDRCFAELPLIAILRGVRPDEVEAIGAAGNAVEAESLMVNEPSVTRMIVQILHLFSAGIALSLIIAVITLAVMQLLHPLVRGITQWRELHLRRVSAQGPKDLLGSELPKWLQDYDPDFRSRFDKFIDTKHSIRVFPKLGVSDILRSVSNGLLMKRIQACADQLLARPSLSVFDFRWLTEGAPAVDANTVLLLDILAVDTSGQVASLLGAVEHEPSIAGTLADAPQRGSGRAEAVAAAQQSVSTAAERNLDALQLRLDGTLAVTTRVVCLFIGLQIAALAAAAVEAPDRSAVGVVGIVGGLLGALFQDVLSSALRTRR